MDNILMNQNYGLPTGINVNEQSILSENNVLQFVIDNIVKDMKPYLRANHLVKLNNVLMEVFNKYEAIPLEGELKIDNVVEHNRELIEQFLKAKSLEGLSPRTLDQYGDNLYKLVEYESKPIEEITSEDIRDYLKYRQNLHDCSNNTLNNIRRFLSAGFTWFFDEGLILKNPMFKIEKIKTEKTVKKPLSDYDIEKLRMALIKQNNIRNILLFEFLLSSGVRVSELVNLDKTDVDLNEHSCIVLGKGGKERKAYFNTSTVIYFEEYFKQRHDDNPALFVSFKKPYNRLTVNAIERVLREVGYSIGISKVHPHRFRRTFASNLIKKGVPIEEVQKLLGHEKLETTTIYAMVDDEQVQFNHKKYAD